MKAITDGALKHVEPLAAHIGSRPIAREGIYVPDRDRRASNHYIFHSIGTLNIVFTNGGIRDLYHTQSDTFAWINGQKQAESTPLALNLIKGLDTKDLSWN